MTDYKPEELLPIVAHLTEQYTSKESSSITYEKARQLMDAVIYCIEERECMDTTAVQSTKENSAIQAYEVGYQLVRKKVMASLNLYHEILKEFKTYRNRVYEDTVLKGIPQFFRYYDAKFNPQNTILTLDYPVLISVEQFTGIDAIYQYLQYIRLEQYFLNEFPESYVLACLEEYHPEQEELFINLCSIVLRKVLETMEAASNTNITTLSEEKLEEFYCDLLKKVIQEKFESNEQLYSYLGMDIKDFSTMKKMIGF